jgi:hypothetical protein
MRAQRAIRLSLQEQKIRKEKSVWNDGFQSQRDLFCLKSDPYGEVDPN